jgi:hypothetical protein
MCCSLIRYNLHRLRLLYREVSVPIKDIDGIMIDLKRGRDVLLFILLSANGGLNRMGNGIDIARRNMLIRRVGSDVFAQLKPFITSDMLEYANQRSPEPSTQDNDYHLSITFRSPSGGVKLQFVYGAEVRALPEAINTLVDKAIELTDAFYAPTGEALPQRSLTETIPEAFPIIEEAFDFLYNTVQSLQIRLSQAQTAEECKEILADCETLDTYFIRFRNTDGVLGAVKLRAEQRLQQHQNRGE